MKKHIIILTLVISALTISNISFAADEAKLEAAKPAAQPAKAEAPAAPAADAKPAEAKPVVANANDPFSPFYKEGTQLITAPATFDDKAKQLVSTMRSEFQKQISALPDSEWSSTKKLTGNKSKEDIEKALKEELSPTNKSNNEVNVPTADHAKVTFENGSDAASYKIASCAWHFYFLSMQTKDPKTRMYTEASTKVLASAATAISKFASEYNEEGKTFDAERNDKAIWQGLRDTEDLVFKMANATRDKKENESKKYQEAFNIGTKACQKNGTHLASMVLLKSENKF